MQNVLWVQTEPKDSLWLNGTACTKEYIEKINVVDNVNFYKLSSKPFEIYHNRYKHEVVVSGHLCDKDSAKRRIPFAFYIDMDNIFKIVNILKNLLKEKGCTIFENECDSVLALYFNQKFIPFLTKKKLKGITMKFLIALVSVLFFFIVIGSVLN